MTTMPPMSVAPGVWLAARLSGARPYLHVHDFETDAAFHLGLLRRSFMFRLALAVERRLLRAFPAVSTISPRMRQRLIEKGVPPRNAFLIPNWASVGDFEPMQGPGAWPERLKKNPQTIVALYSGNVGRKQGIETIVAAARILKDDPNILFVISGDGAARREIEDSARDLTNIAFLPVQPLKEFRHLMIAADIHLLPQRSEAADLVMPSKLGNILASGRPVVAGALPGTQVYEAIEGCGVAVAPDNAEAFAAAISAIARDAGMRAEMGHQGRRRALAEWGKESILLQLEKLLGTIVPPS
jgi:colanic acid biosynthesis glycosyl transferase WcaI